MMTKNKIKAVVLHNHLDHADRVADRNFFQRIRWNEYQQIFPGNMVDPKLYPSIIPVGYGVTVPGVV